MALCILHHVRLYSVHRAAKIPLSPDTSTRNGYLWLYEDKLPRIRTYGIETYQLIFCRFLFGFRIQGNSGNRINKNRNKVSYQHLERCRKCTVKSISENNRSSDQNKSHYQKNAARIERLHRHNWKCTNISFERNEQSSARVTAKGIECVMGTI